jgi:predicted DNA-binding WGR domain protein
MIAQSYHIYIERTEPAKNMARYYAMEISRTLFGEACLTRTWGRIGRRGQSKMEHFGSEGEAVDLISGAHAQKAKTGISAENCLHEFV